MTDHLFVYGTLRRNSTHPMAEYLANRGEYRGKGTAVGLLYDLGRFPGMIEVGSPQAPREEILTPNVRTTINGDVYLLKSMDKTLSELDRYETPESPLPFFFERGQTNVTLTDGDIIRAQIYWYRGEVKEWQRIASGDYFERGDRSQESGEMPC